MVSQFSLMFVVNIEYVSIGSVCKFGRLVKNISGNWFT